MTHIPGHFQAQRQPVNRLGGPRPGQPQGINTPIGSSSLDVGGRTLQSFNRQQQVQPQPIGQPVPLGQPQAPQFGQIGSEAALQAGLGGALGALNQFGQAGLQSLGGGQTQANQLLGQARGDITGALGQARGDIVGGFGQAQNLLGGAQQQGLGAIQGAVGQGVQGLQGFQQPGQQAFNLLGAQSGALGQQAQQQAFQNFQESPGTAFLREQGLRQLGSGAAAQGGGTRGGDFSRDLSRFNQGLALQDLTRQQGVLQGLGGQGLQAAGQIGQLRGQQAGLESNLIGNLAQTGAGLFGQQAGQLGQLGQFGAGQLSNLGQVGAGQAFNFGQAGANLLQNQGINRANLFRGTAGDVSRGRLETGRGIAGAIGAGAGDVSRLQQTGGAGLSDILGGATGAAANLQADFGNLSAADQQFLLNSLVNLGVGQGSQLAGQPSPAQFLTGQGILPQLGSLAGGIGGLLTGLNT